MRATSVGTWERGLARFDPVAGSFTEYHFDKRGLESQIWIIRELHDGRLLLLPVIDFGGESGRFIRLQFGFESGRFGGALLLGFGELRGLFLLVLSKRHLSGGQR